MDDDPNSSFPAAGDMSQPISTVSSMCPLIAPGTASSADLQSLDIESTKISVPQIEIPEMDASYQEAEFDFEKLADFPYQVFVLSEYGKPIYVSCGHEEQLCSLFALINAFVSKVKSWKDNLYTISSANVHVHFQHRSPLMLCIVSKEEEQLPAQLDIIFDQILSILSTTQLEGVYQRKGDNYDLRKLLSGTHKYMDGCVAGWRSDISQIGSAIRVFPMQSTDREFLSNTIASCITNVKSPGVAFSLVLAHRQLVAMVRLRKYIIHHKDLHILINLVANNNSLNDCAMWTPICLPHFNDTGFMHAHMSLLWEDSPAVLLILSLRREAFDDLRVIREEIAEKLQSNQKVVTSLRTTLESPTSFSISNIGGGNEHLWHFVYKNRSSQQMCIAAARPPFITTGERKYLLRSASRGAHLIKISDQMQIAFVRRKSDVLYLKVNDRYELQCVFSPFVSAQQAKIISDRLLKTLKTHEPKYFITHLTSFEY